MDQLLPDHPTKGRGAVSNQAGRYEPYIRRAADDGWPGGWQAAHDNVPPRLETTISADRSRTIIARNQSPDVPFDRSINPYRGCEHGCVYCFAPSKSKKTLLTSMFGQGASPLHRVSCICSMVHRSLISAMKIPWRVAAASSV